MTTSMIVTLPLVFLIQLFSYFFCWFIRHNKCKFLSSSFWMLGKQLVKKKKCFKDHFYAPGEDFWRWQTLNPNGYRSESEKCNGSTHTNGNGLATKTNGHWSRYISHLQLRTKIIYEYLFSHYVLPESYYVN